MTCDSDLLHHLVVDSIKSCIKYCILYSGNYITYDLISKSCWIYENCHTKTSYMFIKDLKC